MSRDAGGGAPDPAAAKRKAEIVRLLIDAGDSAKAIVAATLRDFDAPGSVADTLWALATSEKPATLRDIAGKLGRDPSTVSLAADKLEHAGLIARQPHPSDGRKRTLVLTEHGHTLWNTLRDQLHASRLFHGLGADDQLTLLELLRKIY
jgi:DNA-binding MarR family transcriptional regulator